MPTLDEWMRRVEEHQADEKARENSYKLWLEEHYLEASRANYLRWWREEHFISRQELAHYLVTSYQVIWRWERGYSPVPPWLELALIGIEQKMIWNGRPCQA